MTFTTCDLTPKQTVGRDNTLLAHPKLQMDKWQVTEFCELILLLGACWRWRLGFISGDM